MSTLQHDDPAPCLERQKVWHIIRWQLLSPYEQEQKAILHPCQQNSLSAKGRLFCQLLRVLLLPAS